MISPRDTRYKFACELAKQAGQIALGYQQRLKQEGLTIDIKGQQDFVSEADKATEDYIRKALEKTFPEDGFLGEESGASLSEKGGVWVVDPIDGTTNFLRKQPTWCVSIAFLQDDESMIGVIYDACRGELFSAIKDQGAWLNGQKIKVNQQGDELVGLVNLGYSNKVSLESYFSTIQRLLENGIEHRRTGSAALALAHVASGQFDGFREDALNAWDMMAGVLIAAEAGATVFVSPIENGYKVKVSIPSIAELLAG
ncbi:inositol monophosphatase family protein [Marinomonas sp.]|uniref:inositol monophosphatase family protein n=1 Tax=Marinomonas sp. TaxID=1904862 RepID=UPI003BAA8FF7